MDVYGFKFVFWWFSVYICSVLHFDAENLLCELYVDFQRNSSLSPERSKYEWSGSRSPDVASESGKRRKIDDKVCSVFVSFLTLFVKCIVKFKK